MYIINKTIAFWKRFKLSFYKDPKNELSDTIEFFDSHIDLLEVAMGELEAYLSDYFYCDSCSEKD